MSIPHSEIKSHQGVPTIHVDGQPISSVAYFCTTPTEARIASMRRSGINLFTWGLGGPTAHCLEIGWKGGDTFDFRTIDEGARVILQHNPDAWLLPRVGTMAPNWWLKAHPEEQAVMSTGLTTGPGVGMGANWSDDPRENCYSQASDLWQKDCEMALEKLVEHIDASDWGHRCIGIQPNGGVNEWFVGHARSWSDYSPLAVTSFRQWLRDRGVEGWETAEPPRPEQLEKGTWGGWYDPAVSTICQNWWRFYHGLNVQRLLQTCSALKRVSDRRLVVGAFYGYIGDSYGNAEPAAWLYGHHHPLEEVTGHPDVDFLAAPFSYQNRQPGGTPENQIPTASCDLADCFSFTENDLGTFWSVKNESPEAIAKTQSTMVRDQGQRIIRRQGFWWMDLLIEDEWYTHPVIEDLILKLTTLQNQEAQNAPSVWRPEIAVVLGNDSPFHCKAGHLSLPEWVTKPLRNVLPAIGAPMDVLVLNDLARENLPDYRLFVFLDIPSVTSEQREVVHRVLSERKALAYFQGLPGLINETRLDIAQCGELTGLSLKLIQNGPIGGLGRRGTARFTNFDHPFVQGVPPSHMLGGYPSEAIAFIQDPDATVLGTQSLKGRPAVATKEMPAGWTSVFSSFAGAPPVFFRNLAQEAGVHCFTDVDAVVDACDNLLLVHQIGPGPVRVALHRPWTSAEDRITGKVWDVQDGHVVVDGPHGTSHLLGPA